MDQEEDALDEEQLQQLQAQQMAYNQQMAAMAA